MSLSPPSTARGRAIERGERESDREREREIERETVAFFLEAHPVWREG